MDGWYNFETKANAVKVVNNQNRADFMDLMNYLCKNENFSRGRCCTSYKHLKQFQRLGVESKIKTVEITYLMNTGKLTMVFLEKSFGKNKKIKTVSLSRRLKKTNVENIKNDLRDFFT